MNLLRRWKRKRKSKRDMERLALYRDWPPDLVDRFIRWDNDRWDWSDSPKGYVSWKEGKSYAEFLVNGQRENIVFRKR